VAGCDAFRGNLVRVTGERSVPLGLLLYLLLAVGPTLLFWAALRLLPAARDALARRAPRIPPAGPPVESLIADARRLRRAVCAPARNRVRRVALLQAYDETLADLCRVLDVPAPALVGTDRAYARLQVEAAVEAAGVALDPAPPTGGPREPPA
jgi:hypothetical protein